VSSAGGAMGELTEDHQTAMARARPRVAAIIPAWNEASSIGLVVAALPQALVDLCIVVDGGSTDGTADVARSVGATVIG